MARRPLCVARPRTFRSVLHHDGACRQSSSEGARRRGRKPPCVASRPLSACLQGEASRPYSERARMVNTTGRERFASGGRSGPQCPGRSSSSRSGSMPGTAMAMIVNASAMSFRPPSSRTSAMRSRLPSMRSSASAIRPSLVPVVPDLPPLWCFAARAFRTRADGAVLDQAAAASVRWPQRPRAGQSGNLQSQVFANSAGMIRQFIPTTAPAGSSPAAAARPLSPCCCGRSGARPRRRCPAPPA